MKNFYLCLIVLFVVGSCASKEDIYYLQDAEKNAAGSITYPAVLIQPNDILKITVESLNPVTAIPYNKGTISNGQNQTIEQLQLNGYLVDIDGSINFPVLGVISTKNKTPNALGDDVKTKLITGGHLSNPNVDVRIINAKVTVLGEVNKPGTYNFTEQNITLMQVLGYAGDLTINGKRDDVLVTREINGVRQVSHVNLTSAEFMKSPYYFVKPNDLIIINPNKPKVASSGFVGNVGTVATVISLVLSMTILLTR